jgi:hypothetical protein
MGHITGRTPLNSEAPNMRSENVWQGIDDLVGKVDLHATSLQSVAGNQRWAIGRATTDSGFGTL